MNLSGLMRREDEMEKELRRMDLVEYGIVLFLFALLTAAIMVVFVMDFDRIFPPTPIPVRSDESLQAVRTAHASGALERRLRAVDNPLWPAPHAVSNFLDIDHASKRQASRRRP